MMKKMIGSIFAVVMLFACTVPVAAGEILDVGKNTVVTANSDEEYSRLAIDGGAIFIVPKGTTATMDGSLIVLGTLIIQGKMTGEVSAYLCGENGKVILLDKGSAFLSFSREEDVKTFASSVVKSNADVLTNGCSVKVLPCLHGHPSEQTVNATVCGKCGEVLSYEVSNTASVLSAGYPEIVCGIGGIAIGAAATLLFSRRKKAAVSSTSAENEE